MSHQYLLDSMPPIDRFSVVPYLVDPQQDRIGGWLLDHGTAHADFITYLPVMWGWWYIGDQTYGISSQQNLVDVDMQQTGQATWWTFANHVEHFQATNLLPLEIQLA
jgi:hypothetical protein